MTGFRWYQTLSNSNNEYKVFCRENKSHFILDFSQVWQVLNIHEQLQDRSIHSQGGYYHIKVDSIKSWIPLLPGYTIYTTFGNNIFKLFIEYSNEQQLLFSWIDFGTDENNLTSIASDSQPDRFQSFIQYIKPSGKVSIPFLMGINVSSIARMLKTAVCKKYPELYPECQAFTKAQKTTEKMIETIQKKGKRLRSELLSTQTGELVYKGMYITSDMQPVNPENFYTVLSEQKHTKNQLYNANRQIKRLKIQRDYYIMDEERDDNNNNEILAEIIQDIIKEAKLGSMLLISTEQYLSLILQQSCDSCGDTNIINKKWNISTAGFSTKILIKCQVCKTIKEFSSDSESVNLNSCVATAGLVGGINRQSLQMAFACAGITSQLCKTSYYYYQSKTFKSIIESAEISAEMALQNVIHHYKVQGKNTLPVSFDCSWSHVRNAQQASGEMIYDGRDVKGYSYKPIIAFHVVEKSRKIKKENEEDKILKEGNFDLSSRQMEHAVLIGLIEKLTPVLEKHDMLLNITIDGDLDSNKTLGNVGIVNQIFADLKHVTKNIRKNLLNKYPQWSNFEQHIMVYFTSCIYTAGIKKSNDENCSIQEKDIRYIQTEGLFQHLCDNHNLCWEEVCWIKNNPELQLAEPTLKSYTPYQREKFKSMLDTIFRLPVNQGIGTKTRTSQNEAFNRIKLVYLDKKIDYWKSYSVRHALAILHNNEGICEMMNLARLAGNAILSDQDLFNIKKIEKERNQQHLRNISNIQKRNQERANELKNKREDLNTFDWSQELIPYGKKAQDNINTNKFYPSFASQIPDFDEITKCIACHSFPKSTARGLCRVCRFYVDNGLNDYIIDKNYQSKNEISSEHINFKTMCTSALNGIYQLSDFRSGQIEAIQSFIQNQDTIVIKQTGGGKSLCYTLATLISQGITVVFSPLKALIDDQVIELIKIGIPCGGLYASTEQPVRYQKKIFEEIACGLVRLIFTTPEKFQLNVGFRSMLQRFGTTNNIRFVIDEAHCILDQENFRKSWAYLKNLKELFPFAPILLLTATCRLVDLQEITTRLGINYQQASLIRNMSFENNQIIYEVRKKKDNKENFINDIMNIYNEIEIEKCIIYCPSVKSCENLITELQSKVSKEIISIYHGELSAKQKSIALLNWKSGKIQIMVATNAFGMGVNVPDVRVVIHAGFPMSISNLVQESGRAGRDGLSAKAIVLYNRKDIRIIMGIYSNGQPSINANEEEGEAEAIKRLKYLSEAKHKIREVLFYCSSIYQCRKKTIIDYFAWPEDLPSNECNVCDNCLRRTADNPVLVDIQTDVKKMLEIIRIITSEIQQITRNNVIDVFRQSQAKDVKNKFGELPIYLEKFSRKLKTKEDAFLLLDDLVLRGFVKEDIILTKSAQTFTCSIFIVGIIEEAITKAIIEDWQYLIKT